MAVGRVTFGPRDPYDPALATTTHGLWAPIYDHTSHACNCIGPQNGEKKCPCALRAEMQTGKNMLRDGVVINGSRYRLIPE